MYILSKIQDDAVATMTVVTDTTDHKFEVYSDGQDALVEYQESQHCRGQVLVRQPDNNVYHYLMKSSKMTLFLEKYNLDGVQRANPSPPI